MNKETLHKILRNKWTFPLSMVGWLLSMRWDSGWSLVLNLIALMVAAGCFWSLHVGVKENFDKVEGILKSLELGEADE
jgi:hypothetical protein